MRKKRVSRMRQSEALALLQAFADAYNCHNVDDIMALMTKDCAFISYFGPDAWGERYNGAEKVRQRVASGLSDFPDARWENVKHFVSENRGISEWVFRGTKRGTNDPVERWGVDIFTFKNNKIHVKNTYQKWRQPIDIRQEIHVPSIHPPVGRYAHAVKYRDLVYVSGCGPFDRSGTVVGVGDIVAQTTQTLENLAAILQAAGSSFGRVIKETVYLTDIDERQATRSVRQKFYGEFLPASTLIEISRCVDPDMKIEIDVVAGL